MSSGAMVEIGRLNITLHGISATVAEAAVGGLEDALRRRLGALRVGRPLDLLALTIDAMDLPPDADAAALRELLDEALSLLAIDGSGVFEPTQAAQAGVEKAAAAAANLSRSAGIPAPRRASSSSGCPAAAASTESNTTPSDAAGSTGDTNPSSTWSARVTRSISRSSEFPVSWQRASG